MSLKPVLSVRLKDEFSITQCFEAAARIRKISGVINADFVPEGCFGQDVHRLWVTYDPATEAENEIRKQPEVQYSRPGYIFD